MHKSRIALTIALLLLTTLSASASAPAPGPFSTTGYTTNLVPSNQPVLPLLAPLVPSNNPDLPPLVPREFEFLPSGYVKFHIHAQGGPAYDADSLPICQALAPIYGLPPVNSCNELCELFGEACGAHDASGYFEGSFAFDEWAILDPTGVGANDGLLTVASDGGTADMRFGGSSTTTVNGTFQFLGGSGEYEEVALAGTYTGNVGYVFKVDYTPCGGDRQPKCPKPFCNTHGEALKLKGAKATWDLVNDGGQAVVLQSLLLFWPEANGALTSVSLAGNTLDSRAWSSKSQPALVDLTSLPAGIRKIPGRQGSTLTLKFENPPIGELPADYTFQAEFAEGCSAIHVAFPEQ